jgi:glutamyl-tRNA reductase
MQFFQMQLFWAALPRDIHKVVAQHDPNTMTLDDMYQIATTTQRETGARSAKTIAAVNDES